MKNPAFKVTAAGRELLAALMETGEGLEITRVAVGSGKLEEGQAMGEMTRLVKYEAEAAVGDRRHEDNKFYLTVQYANTMTPGKGVFYLGEFIVEARHPVTGESVVLIYATMGDLAQPILAYSDVLPPDIHNYPLVIVLSDEVEVHIQTEAGLVTFDELKGALENHNADPLAHEGIFARIGAVTAARVRESWRPDYGLGGGGEDGGGKSVVLELEKYTGTKDIAAIVSGKEYDSKNLGTDGAESPNGTIIIKKLEEENHG